MTEEKPKKKSLLLPRGLPDGVRLAGVVYEEENSLFRYVFTGRRSGWIEVTNGEEEWWRVSEFLISKHTTLKSQKEAAITRLIGWVQRLFVACAIDATGGPDTAHFVGDDRATLCGIISYYDSPYAFGARTTTKNPLKVGCLECRQQLVNAVTAMPFLV